MPPVGGKPVDDYFVGVVKFKPDMIDGVRLFPIELARASNI